MEIRFLEQADIESFVDVLHEMSQHYNGDNASSREVVKSNLLTNILGEHSDVRIVVARINGLVVGVAMISILYPAPKERAQLFMKELYVLSDFRSHGVGRALMQWIARYAVANNCVRFDWTVDADNGRVLDFYRRMGATHVRDKLYFRLAGADLEAFANQDGEDGGLGQKPVARYRGLETISATGLPTLPETQELTLQTERLDLVPITREHAPAMFEVLSDPALYRYVTGTPPADVAALTRKYEFWEGRRSPDGSELWLNWALRLRGQKQLIGHLQAALLPDHADVAWVLGVRRQHQGFATEAAKAVVSLLLHLGAHEIHASIHPTHLASIGVAERLGLRRTNELSEGEQIWKRVYSPANCSKRETG